MGVAAKTPDTTLEDWQRVMDVNLKGTFLNMKCVIPAVRDSEGGNHEVKPAKNRDGRPLGA